MKYYAYDTTGRYIRTEERNTAPIVPDIPEGAVVLIPRFTTADPGINPENKRWNGTTWVEVPVAEFIQADYAKKRRDLLLKQSDIFVLPDRWELLTDSEKELWRNYRQALRDLPSQEGFPITVQWPTLPTTVNVQ